jgi:hypothetical protein
VGVSANPSGRDLRRQDRGVNYRLVSFGVEALEGMIVGLISGTYGDCCDKVGLWELNLPFCLLAIICLSIIRAVVVSFQEKDRKGNKSLESDRMLK